MYHKKMNYSGAKINYTSENLSVKKIGHFKVKDLFIFYINIHIYYCLGYVEHEK